jgi:hypothetical protein
MVWREERSSKAKGSRRINMDIQPIFDEGREVSLIAVNGSF